MGNSTEHEEKIKRGLLQSHALYNYILETSVYPRELEPLKELRDITAHHSKAWMGTAPDAGQFITMMLKLLNAKNTIEITAIDLNREYYDIGLPIIKKAGVEHKIDFIESKALSALDHLLKDKEKEGSFDYAFVDADKGNYWNYHERLMKLLKVGGVVIYDNTLWGGTVAMSSEEEVPEIYKSNWKPILELNKLLAEDPRVQLSHVPLGAGITICRRIVRAVRRREYPVKTPTSIVFLAFTSFNSMVIN
ncbi:hypothetical protein QYF36_003863 [Acer negundo]|nr:hypothetical protein QYF36_003863 [Acer negundo]